MQCHCGKVEELNASNKNVIKSKYEMIEMDEAHKRLKKHFSDLSTKSCENVIEIRVDKINGFNCYLSAENIYSLINVPFTPTSMMDGYGIVSSIVDFNSPLIVVDQIFAGEIKENIFNRKTNECVYVTTGSPLPSYIDLVVPIEYAIQIEHNKLVRFNPADEKTIKSNKFIRNAGSDIKEGELIIPKNKEITINHLGIIASAGIKILKVFKLPKIGIASTGNEIIDLCDYSVKNKYKVVDTNRMMLSKLIKEFNTHLDIVDYGIVSDNLEEIEKMFSLALKDGCEILITSGGVSMGEKDYVKIFLEKKGEIIFGRLNMKPGKPTTFGKYKNMTIFGLPGNPVSSVICYYLIVDPAIKMYQNPNLDYSFYHRMKIKAKLLKDFSLSDRPEFVRGILYLDQSTNSFYVESTGDQQSSRLNSLRDFNCLICLPESKFNSKKLKCNSIVDVIMIQTDKNYAFHNLNEDSKKKLQNENKNISENTPLNNIFNNSNVQIYTVGTITISDRAYKGEYEKDVSTEELKSYFTKLHKEQEKYQYNLIRQTLIPDDRDELLRIYKEYTDSGYNLIVTSGGTGLTKRDITNEVTKSFIDKEATGISTYILTESIKITKFACLSNPVVGVKGNSLIVTLPGSPKAIKENLTILENILPHILNQITEKKDFH